MAATECPEADVIDGAVTLPAGCSGIVLPVAVYLHLEELAADSKHVRSLFHVEQARSQYEIALVRQQQETAQSQLAAALAPVPWHERPGVAAAGYTIGGALAVVAGAWALGMVANGSDHASAN